LKQNDRQSHEKRSADSEREPAEPTAANRAIDPAPHPAAGARLPGQLQNLAETARDYAQASASENTRKAYGSDWRHFSGWARRHGLPALPPDPQVLGLYVAACASGAITGKPDSVATLERRISALRWNFAQRGENFDRADRHVVRLTRNRSRRRRAGGLVEIRQNRTRAAVPPRHRQDGRPRASGRQARRPAGQTRRARRRR
jgi:hypothetical protein